MASPHRGTVSRVIPDRANRALWWLTASLGYPFVMVGPIVASFVYAEIYAIPIAMTFGYLIVLNVASLTIALAAGAAFLHRAPLALTSRKAIAFAVSVGVGGSLLRFIVIRIAYPLGLTPFPEVGNTFFVVQLGLGLIFIAALTAAIVYASSREHDLDTAFLELSRAQVSLAQEEEQVRAEVFDQLHGSLQAQFVAMRQRLNDLAAATDDEKAAHEALAVEQALERAYRDGVQPMTRTLIPAGLEAGLEIALAELDSRLGGALQLDVRMDPIIATMDNPMMGGIHRDARIAAYRIIEEAASNAMEHSHARAVEVVLGSHLTEGAAQLDLRIAHSTHQPVVVSEGSGLARMRARARALGGQISYTNESGEFVVAATLPLARPDGGRWIRG